MTRISRRDTPYAPRTRVPLDNFGKPFENQAAEELFKLREKDPVQSLQWSKGDYAKAVRALQEFVNEHSENLYNGALDFVDGLQEKVVNVENALKQVQFDVERVAAAQNKGWFEENPYLHRRGRVGLPRVRQFFRLIGEPDVRPSEDDELDDNEIG